MKHNYTTLLDIQNKALKGDQGALEVMSEKDPAERAKKLAKYMRSGALGEDVANRYKTISGVRGLDDMITSQKMVSGSDSRFNSYADTTPATTAQLSVDKQFKKDVGVDANVAIGTSMEDQVHTIGLSVMANSRFGSKDKDGLNLDNIDEAIKKDKDLQELMRLTGAKNGADLLDRARTNTANARRDGLVMFGVASLKYKGKNSLEDTAASLDGKVYDTKFSNAAGLTDEENRNGSALSVQRANDLQERAGNMKRLKEGIIDVKQFQDTQNMLDSKKNVKDFGDHVEDFGKAVAKLSGDSSTPTADGMNNGTTGDNNTGGFQNSALGRWLNGGNQRGNKQ